jgi:hypothetical protein
MRTTTRTRTIGKRRTGTKTHDCGYRLYQSGRSSGQHCYHCFLPQSFSSSSSFSSSTSLHVSKPRACDFNSHQALKVPRYYQTSLRGKAGTFSPELNRPENRCRSVCLHILFLNVTAGISINIRG